MYRLIQFYETYCDNVIVAPLVRQISLANNYSKRESERQIASHYYEGYVLLGNTKENNIPIVGKDDYPNSRILILSGKIWIDLQCQTRQH